jgi:farnesyl diphosphate synthase
MVALMSELILQNYLTHHEQLLRELVQSADVPAPIIKDAVLYTLFPGGKRIRPLLVYLCGGLVNARVDSLGYIAAAIELIHCYSLIHDDLPAMDNDDQRRGKPSCHRAFDEATAILVGDGMQALAIEILLTHLPRYLSSEKVIKVAYELVHASGFSGMVSGQSMDLTELASSRIDEPKLTQIHHLKTGKLILSSVTMALAAGDPSAEESTSLREFAHHLGLVFQMQDDYLDQYGQNILSKGRASDSANQKTTFATLYDKNTLKEHIVHLYKLAELSLSCFAEKAAPLQNLLRELHDRNAL